VAMEYKVQMNKFNALASWSEFTLNSEYEKRKLTKASVEGLIERLKEMRNLFSEVCLDNSQLIGAVETSERVRQDDLMKMFGTATDRITARTCENKELIRKNEELTSEIEALKRSQGSYGGAVKSTSTAVRKSEVPKKSNKQGDKKQLQL